MGEDDVETASSVKIGLCRFDSETRIGSEGEKPTFFFRRTGLGLKIKFVGVIDLQLEDSS